MHSNKNIWKNVIVSCAYFVNSTLFATFFLFPTERVYDI